MFDVSPLNQLCTNYRTDLLKFIMISPNSDKMHTINKSGPQFVRRGALTGGDAEGGESGDLSVVMLIQQRYSKKLLRRPHTI